MTEAAEVHVRLVIDSNAKKETEKLRDGISNVNKSQKKWHGGVLEGKKIWGGVGDAAKLGLGVAAGAAVAAGSVMIGAATGAASAYMESAAQVKALAGTLTLLDESGTSFKDMKDVAGDLQDQLESVAFASGQTRDAMMATFTNVIERGGKTIDQAVELTEAMASAGRAIPQGAEGISEAFEAIEMGIIRAKNPIVGMISATHLLKGNAKSVAQQMQKMSPEAQMKLAEKAVAAMGKKMKDVPLGIGEMTKGMELFVDRLAAAAGAPIVKAIGPVMGKVHGWLQDNHALLGSIAVNFGNTMALGVKAAGPFVDELMGIAKSMAIEMNATTGPMADLRTTFQYIYDNRGLLAKSFRDVARAMKDVMLLTVKGVQQAGSFLGSVIDKASKLGEGGKAAAQQEALSKGKEAAMAGVRSKEGAVGFEKKAGVVSARAAYADAGGALEDFDKDMQFAMKNHAMIMEDVNAQARAAIGGNATAFSKAWEEASGFNDAESMKAAATFLDGSEKLKDALVKGGDNVVKGGLDAFIAKLNSLGLSNIAEQVETSRTEATKAKLPIGKTPNINQTFTGSINVNQDFKDEDPERVAIVFRTDIAQHGLARLGARTST